MRVEDFDFALPPELIAQQPAAVRTASRLLHVPAGDAPFGDLRFPDLGNLLRPGDLLVLNDTRVLPGRLHGRKASGGRIEMLLEREISSNRARVQLRASHPPGVGTELVFEGEVRARVAGRDGQFFLLDFDQPVRQALHAHGHVPLPPYIRRPDELRDRERYQTVYAAREGAVAAPTAGLHFDEDFLAGLRDRGVGTATLTLHVGAGTFQPLREEQLTSGRLHAERFEVSADLCQRIAQTKAAGARVVAVGTTTVRALESAASKMGTVPIFPIASVSGETDLFIQPGHDFRVVDALLTNFHLPRSSLLMLVCAFGGRERVLAAYRHAVAECYRFFSYGDAMFLERSRG